MRQASYGRRLLFQPCLMPSDPSASPKMSCKALLQPLVQICSIAPARTHAHARTRTRTRTGVKACWTVVYTCAADAGEAVASHVWSQASSDSVNITRSKLVWEADCACAAGTEMRDGACSLCTCTAAWAERQRLGAARCSPLASCSNILAMGRLVERPS